MIFPFSLCEERKSALVGTPTDGDLVVQSGQTVDIVGGSVLRYRNVNIKSGGTLRITGNTASWTEIGVTGDFTCDGTLVCRAGYPGQSTHGTVGPTSKTSVFGLGLLSYSIVQRAGGNGGSGEANSASGGSGSLGIGGGGGGGNSNGGNGGSNGANGQNGTYSGGTGGGLGAGNSTGAYTGASGGSGGGGGGRTTFSSGFGGTSYRYGGGGGGGGYKGHHGKGLTLVIDGKIGGSGNILCSGIPGFNGGNGFTTTYGGGGGGGGAGGSGGFLVVLFRDRSRGIIFSAAGGAGGSGGAAGTGGINGGGGTAGNAGTVVTTRIS
jgi:hypothetical protein